MSKYFLESAIGFCLLMDTLVDLVPKQVKGTQKIFSRQVKHS
jgi:hypothetical protein